MNTHELKTWPKFFQDVWDGKKTFELRKNDRNFKVNDMLILREYDPGIKGPLKYTGRQITTTIGYVLNGTGGFGLKKGYSCLAFNLEGAFYED